MADFDTAAFTQRGLATENGVRDMLERVRPFLARLPLSPHRTGEVEIALAEALNNVAEHAYAGRPTGQVTLQARLISGALAMTIIDQGKSLPGQCLPDNGLPDSSGPLLSLPEGGFGWHLIRQLTHDLHYSHQNGENSLTLCFSLDDNPTI